MSNWNSLCRASRSVLPLMWSLGLALVLTACSGNERAAPLIVQVSCDVLPLDFPESYGINLDADMISLIWVDLEHGVTYGSGADDFSYPVDSVSCEPSVPELTLQNGWDDFFEVDDPRAYMWPRLDQDGLWPVSEIVSEDGLIIKVEDTEPLRFGAHYPSGTAAGSIVSVDGCSDHVLAGERINRGYEVCVYAGPSLEWGDDDRRPTAGAESWAIVYWSGTEEFHGDGLGREWADRPLRFESELPDASVRFAFVLSLEWQVVSSESHD